MCRNPGVCGGTNGGTFWESGGTSLHVPPTRAAQAGPLVLVGCLMTPAARHYPPRWPGHNLTPLGRVTQQCAGAARITRIAGIQGGPDAGGACVHRPPSTMCQPFSNRTHYRTHGARITRTGGGQGGPATTAARKFSSGCDCFLPGTPGTNGRTARKSLSALRKTVPGSTGDKRKFAGDTGDK